MKCNRLTAKDFHGKISAENRGTTLSHRHKVEAGTGIGARMEENGGRQKDRMVHIISSEFLHRFYFKIQRIWCWLKATIGTTTCSACMASK